MKYPFNNKGAYLSNTEKKTLAEYLFNEPQPDTIYTNAKGEQRRVFYTLRPVGCIAFDTAWDVEKEDGSRDYHTPGAVIDGAEAQIHYLDVKTGEHRMTYSNEWLKWIGKASTATEFVAEKKEGSLDAYVKTLDRMSRKPPRQMTEEDRTAKWINLKDGTPS